ncbi:uncharacterized protein LOC126264981 [Aethina tumida]|uniref:uncharacterized protein LOC126264981 n=1 Tax=Aethina tumida TaxID=116153 RepID=UPI0021492821|nr:uncharacterized protein LOC126264981 [Aethina tumida]
MTSLVFTIILFEGLYNPIASVCFLIGSLSVAYLYALCGIILIDFNSTVREALFRTNWYLWNVKNRKAMLLFATNTEKTLTLRAGQLILNYELYVWMIHKVFNLYTALLCVNPEKMKF